MSKKKPTPGGRAKKKAEVSLVRSSAAEYLTFVAAGGNSEDSVEMRYEDENVWLTQKMMAALYDVSVPAINQHLKRIFSDNELEEEAVVKPYLITAADGKGYQTKHYSLQAIIAVGFKIENERAVQFRKWANQIVKDYTIQGWTMDAERLKQGGILTDEFFERQLEEDPGKIRLSERKFYQKITDIYATALDYDPSATATKRFFAAIQNKMHFAVHGQTAAEVIVDRGRPSKAKHGADDLGGCPERENPAIRRFHRQELPLGVRAGADAAHRVRLSRHGRDAGDAEDSDDHGRLGKALERIPPALGSRNYTGCWKSDSGTGEELTRERVRKVPRTVQDRLFESDFDRLIKKLPEKQGTSYEPQRIHRRSRRPRMVRGTGLCGRPRTAPRAR